jgi:hypothetical protein
VTFRPGRVGAWASAALCAWLAAISPASARYHGDLNVFAGEKWMNTNDWEPVDQQQDFGIMLAFGIEHAPVWFALDVFGSEASDTVDSPFLGPVDVKATSREYSIGIRKVWEPGVTRPFLGAGGCMIAVDLDYNAAAFHQKFGDNAYGLWIEGGVTWRIVKHMNLGLDVRYSRADAHFTRNGLPVDVAAGGLHAGLLIGYGW